MRLCSYVVKSDTGLAPNPFWGYCTLAVCTPNHMGIRAQKGDWFIGITAINRGNRLVFAMQVSEVLPFEHYYNDPRFEQKKPIIDGTWRQRCGDNMYYKDDAGIWKQHPSIYHCTPEQVEQDLKHPYVFIAELFYYFGDRAIEIPPEYRELIWRRQGCKCEHDLDTVRDFLNWLEANFEPGIHGEPYHKQRGRCKPVR
ncbi:MAG: hypothetical protein NUW24_05780 [Anaerolineae bacterium]|nr:hypothetical protein [Anaerolineae bacterium]MDH7474690.1 hypothetical protein [Anaerolineae bacterium]